MSIKLFLLGSILIFLSCEEKTGEQNPWQHLSEKEKDSIAEHYNTMSNWAYQPSETHRRYKDSAIMVRPDNVLYRQVYSYSYKKRGEHIQAMQLLNEAVTQDIANGKTDALSYRAWSLLYYYRDYEGCVSDVNTIVEMNPKNKYPICWGESCQLLKGQALYKLGKFTEAIKVMKNLLEIERESGFNPLNNYLAYFYLGRCFTEIGDFKTAITYYEDQIEVYDKFTEAHYQLGKLYLELGKKDKATYHLEKAKELLTNGYKMGEPYFERFDEIFMYQIEDQITLLHSI